MTAIHTTIPPQVLPVELVDPNRIITHYESFTLIPKLGPLSYAYLRRAAHRRLNDYSRTLQLFDSLKDHEARWSTLPVVSPETLIVFGARSRERDAAAVDVPALTGTRPASGGGLTGAKILDGIRALSRHDISGLSVRATDDGVGVRDNARIASHERIVTFMNERNPIVQALVHERHLINENGEFKRDLIDSDRADQLRAILELAPKGETRPSALQVQIARNIFEETMAAGDSIFEPIPALVANDSNLTEWIVSAIAESFDLRWRFGKLERLDDSVIVKSREWAFLRKERVEMSLQTPKFRGPLSVETVAPHSELSISDSQSFREEELGIVASKRGSTSATNLLISNQIREKLGTLHDYGSNLGESMSEQGYERDSTRDEKRAIVEATLNEISEINASKTVSVSAVLAANTREYRTEGKDDSFATTEVSFEAFTPVKVTHYLEGIGLVWSPRLKNPYLALKQTIDQFASDVEAEYIKENFVPDPSEPVPTYEAFEPVSKDTRRIRGSLIKDGRVFRDTVEIRLSQAQRDQHYFLDDNPQCELRQDVSWDDNDLDADQYKIYPPYTRPDEFEPNSHIKIDTAWKVLDEPDGKNPNSVWLNVSVTRYKYTEAYLKQLKEFGHARDEVIPARREAVKAQAKRYARLKKEELIKRYENDPRELQEYAFIGLMREMFGNSDGDWSYYHGIITSAIDWGRAKIQPEPADPEHLEADGLSPFHFLNVNAVRFFLPIHEGSEDAFFDAVSNTLDTAWKDLFAEVREYIGSQRDAVAAMTDRMNEEDRQKLMLDEYDSELVLGRHVEAVLSNTAFREP